MEITEARQEDRRMVLDWLRVEFAIEKPGNKLQEPEALDPDGFVAEVKRLRGKKLPLTAVGLQSLRGEYARSIEPARALAAEALRLEHAISDLVNQAYGLTPEEIALMWSTAPHAGFTVGLRRTTQRQIMKMNVKAWQPATGSAPPLQVEVGRHPPAQPRGG